MGENRDQSLEGPEQLSDNTNWYKKVLENRMQSGLPGATDVQAREYAKAYRIVSRLFRLVEDPRIWDVKEEKPFVDLSRAAEVAEKILADVVLERRRLDEHEEQVLIALAHVTGMATEGSGTGNVLNAFGIRDRAGQAEAIIERMRETQIDPDYRNALEAIAPLLRSPIR